MQGSFATHLVLFNRGIVQISKSAAQRFMRSEKHNAARHETLIASCKGTSSPRKPVTEGICPARDALTRMSLAWRRCRCIDSRQLHRDTPAEDTHRTEALVEQMQ